MRKSKFTKPPMTDDEREKRAEAFVNLSEAPYSTKKKQDVIEESIKKPKVRRTKEKVKPLFLRVPESLCDDIDEMVAITGLTKNAICLQLLRPAVKEKLKELTEN